MSRTTRRSVAQIAYESPDEEYWAGQPKSLAGIAVRSFCLGAALATSLIATGLVVFYTESPLWRIPFFFSALSAFHFLEFWTTACYNTPAASIDSFLLTANWPAYFIAHVSATVECLLISLLFPGKPWGQYGSGLLVLLGLCLVAVGQATRSVAMIQCGTSFNHVVQYDRAESHTLITTGIYSVLRHPSYFGFFWWAIGTQLALGNVVCLVGYSVVLWKFFSARIRREEALLEKFFGDEYVEYRKRVGTKIPLVP